MKHIQCLASLLILLIMTSCSDNESVVNVIPMPQEVQIHKGRFCFEQTSFILDEQMDQASLSYVQKFEELLHSKGMQGGTASSANFIVDNSFGPEEYSIDSREGSLEVKASALNGFVYAIQTLKQLLPAEIWSDSKAEKLEIPALHIHDWPRFDYRGLMLDVARHIFSIQDLHRYIDLMEIHKLNRLHLHLTDDQGWRVEIKSHPKLTEIGAWRKGTMIGNDFSSDDGIPYGGYYTKEELKELVSYAASKGISIVPEIDLPGHTQAIVAAYPHLGCTGGPYKVRTTWGVSDDVLCAGNEQSYKMLEDILTELMEIFPSEYIHIGGDECPKVRWEECPKCQAKIKELGLRDDEHFRAEDYLQSYAMNRIETFLNAHGRKIIAWDEALEGNISQSATIMSWRGAAGGIKAAQSGRDAIMAPNSCMYFTHCQSKNRDAEPLAVGGYVPVNKVYDYEPYDSKMSEAECAHIAGVQACLWTEHIQDFSLIEYLVLPRLDALSEVQWCEAKNKDWNRFRTSLWHMKDIYDQLGCNYATHIFDGRMDEDQKPVPPIKHKALGCQARLLTEPHLNYHYNAPYELFDGQKGDSSFSSGKWIGFEGNDLDVVFKMGNKSFESVGIETLTDIGNYIMSPTWLKVYVSEDGENFTLLASDEYEADGPESKNGIRSHSLSFSKPQRSKYLRVQAGTIDSLPAWHTGHGAKAFLFVDEIIVL